MSGKIWKTGKLFLLVSGLILTSCLPPLHVSPKAEGCFVKDEVHSLRKAEASDAPPKSQLFLSPLMTSGKDACVGLFAFERACKDSAQGYTDCLLRHPNGDLIRRLDSEDSLRRIRRDLRPFFGPDSLELVITRLRIGKIELH